MVENKVARGVSDEWREKMRSGGYATRLFFVRTDSKGLRARRSVRTDSKGVTGARCGERSLARDGRSGQTFFMECLSAHSKEFRRCIKSVQWRNSQRVLQGPERKRDSGGGK